MRCWWTPWPSWTRRVAVEADPGNVARHRLVDERLRRRAEGLALGEEDQAARAASAKSNGASSGETRWLTSATAIRPASRPTSSFAVLVDDVVLPVDAGAARLAQRATSVPARLWSSIATCSDTWPSHVPSFRRLMKPPRRPSEQACSSSVGQELDQCLVEARDRVARALLEHAQVDVHHDRRRARPDVRAAQDACIEDAQRGLRAGVGFRRRLASFLGAASCVIGASCVSWKRSIRRPERAA